MCSCQNELLSVCLGFFPSTIRGSSSLLPPAVTLALLHVSHISLANATLKFLPIQF